MNVEPWADTPAAAAHLKKSVLTVRRWAASGAIPGVKAGGEWMFKLSEIDAHLNNKMVDPWAQSPRSRSRRRVA